MDGPAKRLTAAVTGLGYLCYNGLGVQRDAATASQLWRAAANRSNAFAQFNLGILYANGDGVRKDIEIAYKYIKAASLNYKRDKRIVYQDFLQKLSVQIPKERLVSLDYQASIMGSVLP
ncbi:MAG TPA: hypothetical protein VEF76_13000 [Patescibacteria group bacterium]|nr:hypothetical protein [Patescibacteria group bacterium]